MKKLRNAYTKFTIILIIALILSGCGTSDNIFPSEGETPAITPDAATPDDSDTIVVEPINTPSEIREENLEEAPAETPDAEEQKELPSSDRNKAIEDNIDEAELANENKITKIAEEESATQGETGVSQDEADLTEDQIEGGNVDKVYEEDVDVDDSEKDTGIVNADDGEEESLNEQSDSPYPVINDYAGGIPDGLSVELLYDKYPASFNYVLVLKSAINLRMEPTVQSPVAGKAYYGQRLAIFKKVEGQYLESYDSKEWYHVGWKANDEIFTGYVLSMLVEERHFQIDTMFKRIKSLKTEVDNNLTVYINNYKNYNGKPPKLNDKTIDQYGYRQNQSAAGYSEPDTNSDFRYIPDGMLGTWLSETEEFYEVYFPSFDKTVWIQRKHISFNHSIERLNQVIVVDRKYQNCGVFEWRDTGWVLVSYTFVTTGKSGQYSLVTPLGDFMVIQKRDKFLYYADGTTDIAGYAPYALRFSAGGYLHGVPVNYNIDSEGNKTDPGMAEYLQTIGTTPKSHMCVRNYTSHAKFLYDYINIGYASVIVIE